MDITIGELLASYNDENQLVNVSGFGTCTIKQLFWNDFLLNKKVDYWFINKRSKACEICIITK
jgi:hypothetical protein